MEKEGKVNLIYVLIASTVIFLFYAMLASGVVPLQFPANNTNASSSFGIGDTAFINSAAFNGTNATFQCDVTTLNTTSVNLTRIVLFINKSLGPPNILDNNTAIINRSVDLNPGIISTTPVTYHFNVSGNFAEGTYAWMCQQEDNATPKTINQSGTNFFTIDNTPPGFIFNITNTSNSAISTEDVVSIAINITDKFTTVHSARLFVNVSGVADNEVNVSGGESGIDAANNSQVNLSYKIAVGLLGHTLNFTIQVNDSVNNVNISPVAVFTVTGDGTPPAVNLSNPIDLFNTSSAGALQFNFTAIDNNDTQFQCDLNISLDALTFEAITGLNVTSGVPHLNSSTTAFTNGTYNWNVTCTDTPGNKNTSVLRSFTVDNIPPVFDRYNLTHNVTLDPDVGAPGHPELGVGDGISTAQGNTIYAFANWTDNLTQPLRGLFQFFNATSASWTTLNESSAEYRAFVNGSWTNFSIPISGGHNLFEGKNISFRVIANDTLGNINDSLTAKNFTIQVNDTTKPTTTINGTLAVNNTVISDTTPTVGWDILERSRFKSINVSVDGFLPPAAGGKDGCEKSAFYETEALGVNNVESGDANGRGWRNGSITISGGTGCPLGNGTHGVRVIAIDAWGNKQDTEYNFSVQSGSQPGLFFNNMTSAGGVELFNKSAVNNTNITSKVGLRFFGVDGVGANVSNLTYVSSCNSSTTSVVFVNNTVIFPFNTTSDVSCGTTSENRTLTITVTDSAGNSNTTVFGFLVDNKAPSMTVNSPSNNEVFSEVQTKLNVTLLDDDQPVNFFGYFLDGNDNVINSLNSTQIVRQGTSNTTFNIVNLTPGTHTIKLTANDTLGNQVNSTLRTITQIGPVNYVVMAEAMNNYSANVFSNNSLVNVSIKAKRDSGSYGGATSDTNTTTNTFRVEFTINGTVNASLVDLNGSQANWDKINFTPYVNHSHAEAGVENNWTNTVVSAVWFNNSVQEFITDNNSYFGQVELTVNISGNTSTAQELWWIPDEENLNIRTNITSQCTGVFAATDTTPCWNYSTNGKTIVFVPHLSMVVAVNDSTAPNITSVNVPTASQGNHTVSMFAPNITVSSDTKTCTYSVNSSDGGAIDKKMTVSSDSVSTTCLGVTERFKNVNAVYNLTFNATDYAGQSAILVYHLNISDNTLPTNPNSSKVTASPDTTTASITVSGINESVNVNISYGTSVGSLGTTALETDFNVSQVVSLSSLDAGTLYHFNVSVCDYAGNCAKNGTFNFTTSAASSSSTSTSSSGSSGGGGGGGAAPSKVAASQAQVWSSIPVGSSFSLDINKGTIAVTSVKVNGVKIEGKNVEIEVAALTENPVSTEAAAKVYQYLRITKKNLKNEDADTFTIAFRVPQSWLSDNNLGSGDISLYRYNDGWEELNTRVVSSDSTYIYLEADTAGFSSFAVGVKGSVQVEEEAPEEEEAPTDESGEVAPPIPVKGPAPIEAPGKAPTAWIIAAIVVILGIVLIVVYQKKKQG
jgi:PGF-pre-PGF domain-containing protein